MMRVSAYLGVEKGELEGVEVRRVMTDMVGASGESDPDMVEYLREIAEYNKRRGVLEGEVEKISLTELLDAHGDAD